MPGRARVLGFLKEMPSEKISEISIEPLEFRSLVSERIVITDKKDIEEISSSIRMKFRHNEKISVFISCRLPSLF